MMHDTISNKNFIMYTQLHDIFLLIKQKFGTKIWNQTVEQLTSQKSSVFSHCQVSRKWYSLFYTILREFLIAFTALASTFKAPGVHRNGSGRVKF